MSSCPFEIDVVRWVTGDTRLNELERVERHVAGCAICQAKAESLRSMLNHIADPPRGPTNESSPKVFVDSVMERIGREGSKRTSAPRRRLAFVVGLALPLVFVGGWMAYRMTGTSQRVRATATSAPSTEQVVKSLVVVRDGAPQPLDSVVLRPSDQIVVRYDNPSSKPLHFVALTLDAHGDARWLYPAGAATQPNPEAIVLRARSNGPVAERAASVDRVVGERLRIVTITAENASGLDRAKSVLEGHPVDTPVRALFDNAEVEEWVVRSEALPKGAASPR
jgi:hypothetical protein